ncbi:outer membrane beta-barrel family protein [Rhizosphaericola mali]|uniref:TonB-dependent receptor n=1 Tax=Rhizosphaericola mali TaxID=2545455 RepID=A0A5P2G2D2_9BACT|nr:outer membrane beta-barrel family protein [Rhizosphaericola mali]QES89966.1 TonB-dependent receptor [Rhizosphaericola mali]
MKKIFLLLSVSMISIATIQAQEKDTTKAAPNKAQFQNRIDAKNGHLYGKIVDATTNKGIGSASVQLFKSIFDSSTNLPKEILLTTVMTSSNGDFEFNDLPTHEKLKLSVNALSYTVSNQDVSFGGMGAKPVAGNNNGGQGGFNPSAIMGGGADKNLGDIALTQSATDLNAVTVTSSTKPIFQMGVDRKIFNADRDIANTGQTAQELLSHIPTVNVDIDGNVTMRNATPQIYVDGMPTTLTLEQIPSDLIDKVELITNPSAKYDASGGGGGIINIVLKKNKKTGYNGGLRAGGDTRWGSNLGGDFSYRQGKFNLTADAMYMRRRNKSTNTLDRTNTYNNTTLLQDGSGLRTFRMMTGNLSMDYLMDNKNTFTLGGGIFDGHMGNDQPQHIDSIDGTNASATPFAYSNLNSLSKMHFTNYNGKFNYKHSFGDKDNHDLTANFQYNSANGNGFTDILTQYYNDPDFTDVRNPALTLNTNMINRHKDWIGQVDYENPLSDKSKFEAGLRAEHQTVYSDSRQFTDSTGGLEDPVFRSAISSKYNYQQTVLAAYAQFSSKIGDHFSYQVGIRAENSNYSGTNVLMNTDQIDSASTNFKVKFPVNIFPSLFLTYTLPNDQCLQFNYSRKVNRPNFFQLLPIYNYSDPYNISTGNPDLKPEFTSNYELSYNKTYSHSGNFLATGYMRYTSNMITNYQYTEPSEGNTADSVLVNTYMNANHSYTYGLELTNSIAATKKWTVTGNVNLYRTVIDASNTELGTTNKRVSWNAKLNNEYKLPWGLTFQANIQYFGKTVLPNSGGSSSSSSGGRNGGGFNFSSLGTAQGYIGERFFVDAALKKDWKGKNGNSFSVTASMNDIFRSNYNKTFSETAYMEQYQKRLSNPQVFRLNFSWRFGKMDANLFKRKNNKEVGGDQGGGMEM